MDLGVIWIFKRKEEAVLELIVPHKVCPASLKDLERRVRNTAEVLCQRMWVGASEERRQKYPQYAISEHVLAARSQFDLDAEDYVPEDYATIVCNSLVPLVSRRSKSAPETRRGAGRFMARISMARCMLGAPASRGDFEAYMSWRAKQYALDLRDQIGQFNLVDAWKHYKRGNPKGVQYYLIEQLHLGYGYAMSVACARDQRLQDLCAFAYDAKEKAHYLDGDFLESDIYICTSMLAYLMPEGCH